MVSGGGKSGELRPWRWLSFQPFCRGRSDLSRLARFLAVVAKMSASAGCRFACPAKGFTSISGRQVAPKLIFVLGEEEEDNVE